MPIRMRTLLKLCQSKLNRDIQQAINPNFLLFQKTIWKTKGLKNPEKPKKTRQIWEMEWFATNRQWWNKGQWNGPQLAKFTPIQILQSERKLKPTDEYESIWKKKKKSVFQIQSQTIVSNGHLRLGLSHIFLLMLLWLPLSSLIIWDLIVTLILFIQVIINWQLQHNCMHLYPLTHSS